MIDVSKIVGIVRDETYKKQNTTTPIIRSLLRVKTGRAVQVNRVILRNKTSAATSFTFYIENRGKLFPLSYQASPAQNSIYTLTSPLWLFDGDQLRADYVGATANDEIELLIYGTEHEFNDVLEFRGTKEEK